MLFGICPRTSRTPKFWRTYVIRYGDFMVIVEPFLVTSKKLSSFDLRRTLISKSSSCYCSTVISVELSSFSFFFVVSIFSLILCHLWNHSGTGGDIWQSHFLMNCIAFVKNEMNILKITLAFFNSCPFFFAYSLTVLKPTEVIVDTFSLLLKCRSRSQQTSDCG